MWPTMWRKYYGEAGGDIYATWERTLAGLGARQINRGIEAVRHGGYRYPPSAPEFRRLCAPTAESLGVPGPVDAFARAQASRWDPPIVFFAVRRWRKQTGGDMVDLRTMTEPDQGWMRVYAAMLREIDDGATFDEIPQSGPALPSQPSHVDEQLDPDEARRQLFERFGRRGSSNGE